MIEISKQMLAGMGAAAWLVGFIALMGGFLVIVGIIVTACTYVGQALDEMDRRRDDAAAAKRHAAEDAAGSGEPGVHAPRVGRYDRAGAGAHDR